ncbi:type II toxin-antitoxin system RelE/ParE family toxin [Legionella longbeachae]|uniref:type II toxin-antitoxin system RelE/ParE family toxin n=1 Tax=Legionella longbeachae TaxID=450 RepID=UPI00124665FE|nr:type II toxin-antitoxin system RelE/ParE family toxin [Legionella longbeachae]QEY51608.1 plasmid maintenance system killer protein [Legionella longbeachae]
MIINFQDKLTEDIFNVVSSRYSIKLPSELHKKAQRKLDMIHAATLRDTLKIPPKNKLAKLCGNLSEYWRIKIDKQWAVIFRWENGYAYDVCISDYHDKRENNVINK